MRIAYLQRGDIEQLPLHDPPEWHQDLQRYPRHWFAVVVVPVLKTKGK